MLFGLRFYRHPKKEREIHGAHTSENSETLFFIQAWLTPTCFYRLFHQGLRESTRRRHLHNSTWQIKSISFKCVNGNQREGAFHNKHVEENPKSCNGSGYIEDLRQLLDTICLWLHVVI